MNWQKKRRRDNRRGKKRGLLKTERVDFLFLFKKQKQKKNKKKKQNKNKKNQKKKTKQKQKKNKKKISFLSKNFNKFEKIIFDERLF